MCQVQHLHGNTSPRCFEPLTLFTNYKEVQGEAVPNDCTAHGKSEWRNHIYIPSTSALRPFMDAGKGKRDGEIIIIIINIIYIVRMWVCTEVEGFNFIRWLFSTLFFPPLTIRHSFKLCQLLGEGGQLGLVQQDLFHQGVQEGETPVPAPQQRQLQQSRETTHTLSCHPSKK